MIVSILAAACRSALCALPLAAQSEGAPQGATPGASAPAGSGTAEAVFRARLEYDTGEARAAGLLAFDLDGDGRDELISVVRGPGAVRVWSGLSNRADGALRSVEYGVGDYALGPVRVGAWTRGDAPCVVAVASRNEPGIDLIDVRALHLQRGEAAAGRLALDARPRVLASGDLGADGVPEIAVVTLDDDLLVVRGGAIASRTKLADEQSTCAHFTADGRAILVGSQAARTITSFVPKADGTLEKSASVVLAGLPRRIDEIAGWRGAEGTRFLVAAGDHAVVWLTSSLAIERTEEYAAVPIDVVHTGVAPKRTRLVVAVHGQEASIEREDGGAPWSTYGGQHPSAGALGDFDGDGRLDVALANGDAKRIGVVYARAEGGWNTASFARSGLSPHSIDAGDLDGDGKLDVVALCAKDGSLHVHRGTDGGLAAGVSQGNAEGADRARVVDLDGDGKLDVAFLRTLKRATGTSVVLDAWFGDGTGRLWARGETKPVACATKSGDLLVADLDQDGALEAVVSDPGASRVVVVPIVRAAPGSAAFGEPRAFDVAGAPRELALVSSAKGGSVLTVALTGEAPRAGWSTLRATSTEIVEMHHEPLGERARALAVNSAAATLAYVGGGDGAGTLSYFARDTVAGKGLALAGSWPTGLRAHAVRCGDLDGDGRGDVVVSSQNSHQLNVWLGRDGEKGPTLARMPDVGVGTGPLDVLLVDLDGDGALEIVAACAFSDEIAVVRLR